MTQEKVNSHQARVFGIIKRCSPKRRGIRLHIKTSGSIRQIVYFACRGSCSKVTGCTTGSELHEDAQQVGDYREIYEIDRKANRTIVLDIGHGKNVYDDFSRLV